MPPPDDPGADPEGSTHEDGGEQVDTQLVEALILLLVEKGVLTKNDALSIVQTVAQVQLGAAEEKRSEQTEAAIRMLQRMHLSFDALADRSSTALARADNVLQLRPPIYDGRPEFPRAD